MGSMGMQSSPQESVTLMILAFELDLKEHFLDVCHDTDPLAPESDYNMSEIWLKFRTFRKTGVEKLPIIRFGTTVEHDSTPRGSSIFSAYTMTIEVSYLVCFVIFFIYRPSMAILLLDNTFSPSQNTLPIVFQWRQVFDMLVHSCQQEVDDPSSKEDQLHIAHHQNDRNF